MCRLALGRFEDGLLDHEDWITVGVLDVRDPLPPRPILRLGPAADRTAVLDIQGPAGTDPRVGQTPLELPLLTALVNIQRQLPALIGQTGYANSRGPSSGQRNFSVKPNSSR